MRGKAARDLIAAGAISAAVLGSVATLLVTAAPAAAGAAARESIAASPSVDGEPSVQVARRRGPTRLRVYPTSSYPGPNAVRQCEARYVQEYRQSGTVIVPRMTCWWQRG
jgi:hypothetical protein